MPLLMFRLGLISFRPDDSPPLTSRRLGLACQSVMQAPRVMTKAPPNNSRIVYVELPGLAHWDSGAAR
jgi:hypothetical protein